MASLSEDLSKLRRMVWHCAYLTERDAGSAQTSYEEERYCSVYLILEDLTINEKIFD